MCGAGGFIGAHLARRLVAEGYWVRAADIKEPEFALSDAHEFVRHLIDEGMHYRRPAR